jgi:hypothetical protein
MFAGTGFWVSLVTDADVFFCAAKKRFAAFIDLIV